MAGAFGAWANRLAAGDAGNGAISIEYVLVATMSVLISGLLATVLYPGWGELVRTMAQSIDATAARIP